MLSVAFLFILLILAFLQYYVLTPRSLVVGIPERQQLYFVHNKSYVQTNVSDIVDLCSLDRTLLIVGSDGRIYNAHSELLFQVPVPLKWCAVRRYDSTVYVGSDYGVYKLPGPWRQPWLLRPGTQFVDWHNDEFVTRDTSFRYSLMANTIIVSLRKDGFLVTKSIHDERAISQQYVGVGARGIAWV